jgi:hypothetical protein
VKEYSLGSSPFAATPTVAYNPVINEYVVVLESGKLTCYLHMMAILTLHADSGDAVADLLICRFNATDLELINSHFWGTSMNGEIPFHDHSPKVGCHQR